MGTLVGVREDVVEAGLHDAYGPSGEDHALKIKPGHEDFDALVEFSELVLSGDVDVLKHELPRVGAPHPELVEFPGAGEAGGVFGFEEEGCDTF